LPEEIAMPFLRTILNVLVASAATLLSPPVERSESVLVRAVIDGDTIDVDQFGRVQLLGISAATPFANEARDKLAGLVLHRWIRLESDADNADGRRRRTSYVITGDGVCVNTVLVREGLARVTARPSHARFAELKEAEADAQRLEKGIWSTTAPGASPGYTRRPTSPRKAPKTSKSPPKPSTQEKRRSSWPRSPSSMHRSARFANATSFITGSTTGRSGFSFSSLRPGR
jgi:endonuclease YncB( thermonuclease family)